MTVRRVEVTRPDGSTFVSVASLAACAAVYRGGYRLREVLGVPTTSGFTPLIHLTCDNATCGGA